MKKNKGFTLIELLAVIVILAIIMVIAVPQILNVIDSSRTSAWRNSLKLVANSINTNSALFIANGTSTGQTINVKTLCGSGTTTTKIDAKSNIQAIADIGDIDEIKCYKVNDSEYRFHLKGKNQFSNKLGTIKCTYNGTETACSMAPDSANN